MPIAGGFGGTCLSPTAMCQSWAVPTLAFSTEMCCSHGNLALKRAVDVYVQFIFGTEVGVLLCDTRGMALGSCRAAAAWQDFKALP